MRRYGPKPKRPAEKQSKGIMIRFTPKEKLEVDAAAVRKALRPGTWARQIVLLAAREVKE